MDKNMKMIALAVVIVVIVAAAATAIAVSMTNNQKEKTPEQQYMEDLGFQKFEKYFYGVDYSKVNYDYEYGFEFCRENYGTDAEIEMPGCSACTAGDMFGRCFDWFINESPTFFVRTAANSEHKYSTIGICTFIKGVTDDEVKNGDYSERYWDLPFFTTDGMNEKGLTMCLNVSNIYDGERTTGTNPGLQDMSVFMCVRYILDNAATVGEAVDIINSFDIYCPNSEMINEEFHYLISDANGDTVLVEFVGNTPHFLYEENIMTNFDMTCFYDENDLCLMGYEERIQYERKVGNPVFEIIPDHPMGIERYIILLKNFNDDCATDHNAMFELMKKVYYTQTYTMTSDQDRWYSEIYKNDVDKYSSKDVLDWMLDLCGELIKDPPRNDILWQTVHCSVYDRTTMTMYVTVQENPELKYQFTF